MAVVLAADGPALRLTVEPLRLLRLMVLLPLLLAYVAVLAVEDDEEDEQYPVLLVALSPPPR